MKVILIFLFTFVGMMVVNFVMNLLLGEAFRYSLFDMFGPFWVMEPVEHILAYGLLICVFISPVLVHFKRTRNSEKR